MFFSNVLKIVGIFMEIVEQEKEHVKESFKYLEG